jgi:oligopeptide transport system permease protein
MAKVILYRLVQFPLILAIIYVLTFLLAWVAPGNPFQSGEKNMDPAVEKMLRERFHADSPWKFLAYYPKQVILHGDLGWSMQYREWPVNRIIHDALPVSITLGLFALLIALLVGVGVGTMAAVYRGGVLDWTSLSITLIGISLPSFVTAAVLLVAASMTRGIPVGGWGNVSQVVLPGLALSLAPMAYIARLTRVAMLDVLGSDYVRTARAKGLVEQLVVRRHALRNALIPTVTVLGLAYGSLLSGAVMTETIFAWPGIGRYAYQSAVSNDFPSIMGVTFVIAIVYILVNLVVDLAYALLDPQIRYS